MAHNGRHIYYAGKLPPKSDSQNPHGRSQSRAKYPINKAVWIPHYMASVGKRQMTKVTLGAEAQISSTASFPHHLFIYSHSSAVDKYVKVIQERPIHSSISGYGDTGRGKRR
jgi:hypothetical protein